MTREPDHALVALIRNGVPPVGAPPRPGDLWPRLRCRLEPKFQRTSRADRVLAFLALGLLMVFPEAWLLVLYHF